MRDVVVVHEEGDIVTVTLNRPARLNALNEDMWRRVGEVMRAVSASNSPRCVIVRGAGDRAFSPGADIGEFESKRSTLPLARSYGARMHEAMNAIRECRHPTVALIRGVCVGGGLELACQCDLRICGESSRFGVPINRIGVIMAYPEIESLIDLVGRAVALEILLEGRVFDAAEALAKGLVSRVVADDDVEAEVHAAARRIADGAPLSNRWHKKFARRLSDPTPLSEDEFDEGFANAATWDYQEGYRAFVEKRPPRFQGR